MSDLYRDHFTETEYCTFCPKMCRFACPVAESTANETYQPWGRQTLLHLAREGHMAFDADVAATMYKCASCMVCREVCDYDIDVPRVMTAARTKAVAENLAPGEVRDFDRFFQTAGNPFGDDLAARLRAMLADDLVGAARQITYFAGCGHVYAFPAVVQDTFRIFQAAGLAQIVCHAGDAMCCGAPLRELGLHDAWEKNAKTLAAELKGARTIVTGSAQCAHELKTVLPEAGFKHGAKVFHITEYLWPLMQEGRLSVKRPFDRAVMYHDACHLSRYLGVVEEPRLILHEVTRRQVHEFSRNRAMSGCCGGAGGLPVTNPDIADDIARRRLAEFDEAPEGMVLVTAGHVCERQLARVAPQTEIMDIASVVAKCV
ncbi:(Fe-S)-binding protein [bacterium]|nr:(Fe-S)-binding protein [bacterium]